MTITEFLEARIAEDETAARYYAQEPSGDIGRIWHDSDSDRDDDLEAFLKGPANPARVLAECAAKRQVLEIYATFGEYDEPTARALWIATKGVLKILAAVYKDHPDYQQEWAV